jgi:hypothetical protein
MYYLPFYPFPHLLFRFCIDRPSEIYPNTILPVKNGYTTLTKGLDIRIAFILLIVGGN